MKHIMYSCDILSLLKSYGYTTYVLRKAGIMSESTIQRLRSGLPVSLGCIESICCLLDCQPGDLLVYK